MIEKRKMKKISKEKQEELDKLSKRYFWEQKTNEIAIIVLIVLGFIAALYICSSIILMIEPEGLCDSTGCITSVFGTGLIGLFFCLFFLGVLFLLSWGVYEGIKLWIESNKEKASDRAKKELGIKLDDDW